MFYMLRNYFPSSFNERLLLLIALASSLVFLYLLLYSESHWTPPHATPIGKINAQDPIKRRFKKSLRWWKVVNSQPLFKGDSLYTPENSLATVHLNAGSKIHLGPGSLIKFDTANSEFIDFLLIKGAFEIAQNGSQIKVAGKGAKVHLAKKAIHVTASSKKPELQVKVAGESSLVKKTTHGISIKLPTAEPQPKSIESSPSGKTAQPSKPEPEEDLATVLGLPGDDELIEKPGTQGKSFNLSINDKPSANRLPFTLKDEPAQVAQSEIKSKDEQVILNQLKDPEKEEISKPEKKLAGSATSQMPQEENTRVAMLILDKDAPETPLIGSKSSIRNIIRIDAPSQDIEYPETKEGKSSKGIWSVDDKIENLDLEKTGPSSANILNDSRKDLNEEQNLLQEELKEITEQTDEVEGQSLKRLEIEAKIHEIEQRQKEIENQIKNQSEQAIKKKAEKEKQEQIEKERLKTIQRRQMRLEALQNKIEQQEKMLSQAQEKIEEDRVRTIREKEENLKAFKRQLNRQQERIRKKEKKLKDAEKRLRRN